MRFLSPEWFLLIPAVSVAGKQWPALGVFRPARLLVLLLVALALARPELRRTATGTDLWVLWDVSDSAAQTLEPHRAEYEKLLRESMGAEDRLRWYDFAADSSLRDKASGIEYAASTNATRTARAVRDVMARMDAVRNNRILVVSDGMATEPVGPLREALIAAHVRLDCRVVSPERKGDAAVIALEAPDRVRVREPFVLDATVTGPDGDTRYAVLRDGKVIHRDTVRIAGGRGRVAVSDRMPFSGASRYAVRVEAANDPAPGNDTREVWVEASGEDRILLVTAFDDDPLAKVLTGKGFTVEVCRDPSTLHAGRLSGARAVILNDMPAHVFPQGFAEALAFYVREQGGGLMMAGGKQSFACGGWASSVVDPLLPVSMESKDDTRRARVNIGIALDRSGSMGASAGSGTKMDLADAGAAAAVGLMGAQDRVTVLAVDTSSHEIVPLTEIGPNREKLVAAILRIESSGGGIYVNTALNEAWERVSKAPAGRKHVILFADACDAFQEQRFDETDRIVDGIVKAGGTVSTIGMGADNDPCSDYLRAIAKRGQGRSFFNADPAKLPGLFGQETVTVSRAAFVDEKTGLRGLAGRLEISPGAPSWPSSVDGYNLCYTRPEAVAEAETTDDYRAPLAAHMRAGAGRTAAVTFPLAGPFSAGARSWPGYGDFIQTTVRWLENPAKLDGLAVRAAIDGERLDVELRYADKAGRYDWSAIFSKNAPELRLAIGDAAKGVPVVWQKIRPGLYRASVDLPDSRPVRGAVAIVLPAGKDTRAALPFGPLAVQSDVELRADPARPEELRALAAATGGKESLNLSRAWEGVGEPRFTPLVRWVLISLLVALLVEALATRLGILNFPGSAAALSRTKHAMRR